MNLPLATITPGTRSHWHWLKRWALLWCVALGISICGGVLQLLFVPKYEAAVAIEIRDGLKSQSHDWQVKRLRQIADAVGVEYDLAEYSSASVIPKSFAELMQRIRDAFSDTSPQRSKGLYRMYVRGYSREETIVAANTTAHTFFQDAAEIMRTNVINAFQEAIREADKLPEPQRTKVKNDLKFGPCYGSPVRIWEKATDARRVVFPLISDWRRIFVWAGALTVVLALSMLKRRGGLFFALKQNQRPVATLS